MISPSVVIEFGVSGGGKVCGLAGFFPRAKCAEVVWPVTETVCGLGSIISFCREPGSVIPALRNGWSGAYPCSPSVCSNEYQLAFLLARYTVHCISASVPVKTSPEFGFVTVTVSLICNSRPDGF